MKHSEMIDSDHIVISLNPCHAQNIYAGSKTVEFRRRKMSISAGTKIWIYEKIPVGSITGSTVVESVTSASPEELWSHYGLTSGLCYAEFFEYFKDIDFGFAIKLKEVAQLEQSISLSQLRKLKANFQPPQFFIRLLEGQQLLTKLKLSAYKCPPDYFSKNKSASQALLRSA